MNMEKIEELIKLKQNIKLLQDKSKQIETEIKESMKKNNEKTIDSDICKITYIPEKEQSKIDVRYIKESFTPEEIEKFSKKILVKEQLRITVK